MLYLNSFSRQKLLQDHFLYKNIHYVVVNLEIFKNDGLILLIMLQAIICDYDGTLAPTMERQQKWFKHWSEVHRKTWALDGIKEFAAFYNHHCAKEGGVQNVYNALNLPCEMNNRKHPVWSAYEEFNIKNPHMLYPGVKKTIKTIWELGRLGTSPDSNRRLRLGINTTNSWTSIRKDLEKGGILKYFDAYVTEEVLRAYQGNGMPDPLKKPSPISLALMLGLLDSSGSVALHWGDTLNDLRSSQKIIRLNPANPEKVKTIGACYGYEKREILERGVEVGGKIVTFDYLVDSPEEVIDIVRSLL